MKEQILSPAGFKWFLTLTTGIVAGLWFFYDSFNLIRTRNADRTNLVVRDKHFGYAMGILIGIVGVYGCLRFQGIGV
jgi:hypothetical protein